MQDEMMEVFKTSMNGMAIQVIKYLLIAAIVSLPFVWLNERLKKREREKKQLKKSNPKEQKIIDYTNGYKSKWMFTYNEKDAYHKIKEITDDMGLYLFAKVRLFDLIEPKQDIEDRQAHQFKIQAKHIDFVVCDEKLVARAVIELDDATHEARNRVERDIFVDTVLQNCGYKVFHINAVKAESLKYDLESVFTPITANT